MASFASVHVSVASKTIVPWKVISLDPSQNFEEPSSLFKQESTVRNDLAAAVQECVGTNMSSLSLIDKDLNTVDVCTVFGHYVKFTVLAPERHILNFYVFRVNRDCVCPANAVV